MDRDDVCIVINSTPKYYYLLDFMIGMLRRFSPGLQWPIFLVTEEPTHSVCRELAVKYGVKLLTIQKDKAGFIESRLEGIRLLQGRYKYCLPLQDDFILEMPMQGGLIQEVLSWMDGAPEVASARLMPCPGPKSGQPFGPPNWSELLKESDEYGFVYQATLWRTDALERWYSHIVGVLEEAAPKATTDPAKRRFAEITANIAENAQGQDEFWALSEFKGWKHIAWNRAGNWPNAVYLSPFPYRPTAVVRGKLEPWAIELAKREGFTLLP